MKNNKKITYIATIMAIATLGIVVFVVNNDGENMDDNVMNKSSNSQSIIQADTNSSDYKQYSALKGEEYDRTFMTNMVGHHQGAVEMANLALTNANHQEIKTLAAAIISAQTSEITNMTSWQTKWGYNSVNSGAMMIDHSSMSMGDSNAGMMTSSMMNMLNGKTGDAFDKVFLEQMIMHHQSAINMAATGVTNAQHQEVKDLTVAIVNAQTKEIIQMKQWQKSWGY